MISLLRPRSPEASPAIAPVVAPKMKPGGSARAFFEALSEIEAEYGSLRGGLVRAIREGGQGAHLIKTQIIASELNLKVECVAKAADGALSLTRRLQGAQ